MPHLSPLTLTESEQKAILAATAGNPRAWMIHSLALGTGLRLAEIVGLNVGDVYAPDGTPRTAFGYHPAVNLGVHFPGAVPPAVRARSTSLLP